MKNRDCQFKVTMNTHLLEKKPLKQWRILILLALGVFSWTVMFSLSSVHAATTLCVNPGGTNGCYSLPSLAVVAAAAEGDTILIRSGTYMETGTISITKSLKIIGDNPVNTKVQNSNSFGANVFTFSSAANISAEIANLTITGEGHGIEISGSGNKVTIHHNHIENNMGSGIRKTTTAAAFTVFNNIVKSNSGYGIYSNMSSSSDAAYNNIVTENSSYGINGTYASYNSSYGNGTNGSSNYLSVYGNIGNISQDCLFVNNIAEDYRLQTISPCKNTGNPGYLDVDGSVSDMGSFGGPGAALFWPYGNGGPVVTNLTVDPPYVPEGGNISIKATVEIR